MAELYECDVEAFVSATSIKPLGILVGSLTGAFAADIFKSRADFTIFLCCFVNGVTLASLPWLPGIIAVGAMMFFNGICLGTFNIVCNFLNLYMWQDKAVTPLHLLHMFITLGMAVTPLITIPFLSHTQNTTSLPQNITRAYHGHVQIPYAIFGLYSVVTSLIFLVFFIKNTSYMTCSENEKKPSVREMFRLGNVAGGNVKYAVYFLISLFLLYFCVNGRDRAMSMFLFIIAHTDVLQMSKAASSGLVTAGVLSVTIGRGVAGLLSQWIDVRLLLLLQLLVGCYIQMLMSFYALTSTTWLWTLTCLFGLVTGPTYSSILAWANRYINSSGLVLAVVDVGVGLGSCISLLVNGHLYDEYSSIGVFTLCLVYGVLLLVVYIPLQVTALIHGDRCQYVDTASVFSRNHDEDHENII